MNESIFNLYADLTSQEYPDQEFRHVGYKYDRDIQSHLFDRDLPDDMESIITDEEIEKHRRELQREEDRLLYPKKRPKIEESIVTVKRQKRRRKTKFTEKEIERVKESCLDTIVNDYAEDDVYHLSDSERRRQDQLFEISSRLEKVRGSYSKADQYVVAMRVVYEAWKILAEKNFIHSKEEFFEMVSEGKIISGRIPRPKLKKMSEYNQDLLIEYISNPDLDPAQLVLNLDDDTEDWLNEEEEPETEEEEMARLIPPDEAAYILEHINDPAMIKTKAVKSKHIKGYDIRSFSKKKESKRDKHRREDLAPLLLKIQSSKYYKDEDRAKILTNSFFEEDKLEKSPWDEIRYEGSWADDDNLALYDLNVREEVAKHKPVEGRSTTLKDIELKEFFKILEDGGVNVIDLRTRMNASPNQIQEKELRITRRENKKLEEIVIQRLIRLNKDPKIKKTIEKAERETNELISKQAVRLE